MVHKVDSMNIIRNCIYEGIITSYGTHNEPNAAPIGFVFKEPRKIHLHLYKKTRTLDNLINSKCGVVNITHNAELFYKTTFKEANPKGELSRKLFQQAKKINAPLITPANFNLEFVVERITEHNDRTLLVCRIVNIKKNSEEIQPYSRSLFATIESIIHATRIKAFFANGKNKDAEELIKLVKHYRKLVRRVSPDSNYLEIIDELIKKFSLWRRNSAGNSQNPI